MSSVPQMHRMPSAPLAKMNFDLKGIKGLSQPALELHLGLYDGYVKETNGLLEQLDEFPRSNTLSATDRLIRDGLLRRLSFEHNGVILHELFFESLGAKTFKPSANGVLAEALDASFGGFDIWKRDVIELAQTRGVGWVIAFHSKSDNRVVNAWIDDHRRGLLAGMNPIAVFDLWEHAYMLDFKPSQRKEYMNVVFDNINWTTIEARCA